MQRREQQRRAAGGATNSGYGGGGSSGYSALPQQTHFPSPVMPSSANRTPTAGAGRTAFKGTGMKLGSKKTKQAELLDALGGELASEQAPSTPKTPAAATSSPQPGSGARVGRGNVPTVDAKK